MTQKTDWIENRITWVKALRSGKYKQSASLLKRGSKEKGYSYCCLGVLAELSECEEGVYYQRCRDEVEFVTLFGEEENTVSAPVKAMDWVGLNTNLGSFHTENGDNSQSLAELNDNGEHFRDIADLIESEPEGLFREYDYES